MLHKQLLLFFILLFISKVSSFPIHCSEINNFLEGEDNVLSKRQIDCSSILREEEPSTRPSVVMTDEDRKKLQARLFEGLLHFGTIVNHIDTFIMDKSKMILKSLGKMAESDEDTRFNM